MRLSEYSRKHLRSLGRTSSALLVLLCVLWGSVRPAAAQIANPPSVNVPGKCSVVLNNVRIERDFHIECDNQVQPQMNAVIDLILRVSTDAAESAKRVRAILDTNQGESLERLLKVLDAFGEQMAQLKRAELPFATPGLPVDVALQFNLKTGALAQFGKRLEEATSVALNPKDRKSWPTGYPFSAINWLEANDFFYPQAADGGARLALESSSVEMNCYTREQRKQPALATGINRPMSLRDSIDLPVQPDFGQIIEPILGKCGTGLVVTDAFNGRTAILRAERVAARNGTVRRIGTMTSVVDLFGAVCHVVVRTTANPASPELRQTIQDLSVHSLELHVPLGLSYSTNQNNFRRVDAGPGLVLYLWEMPAQMRDLSLLPVAGNFSPVPVCKP